MAASTLEKLVSLQQKMTPTPVPTPVRAVEQEEELIVETIVPDGLEMLPGENLSDSVESPNPVSVSSEREACMREQLEALYVDLEYLSKHFPGQTIRSLVDLAVHAGLSAGTIGTRQDDDASVEDHGIIPGRVMQSIEKLSEVSSAGLEIGVVELDDSGNLIWMNQQARHALGLQSRASMKGHFFTEIVPGANNSLFYGRFLNGQAAETFDVEFSYAIAYKAQPILCRVHMLRTQKLRRSFIFVKKIEA